MLRRAAPADIPAMIALHERCWRVNYAGIANATAKFADLERWQRVWSDLIGNDDSRVLVAEATGAVAGFVVLTSSRDEDADDDVGEIVALYVDPDRQGSGLGRVLVDAALKALAAAEFTHVTLWTFEHNPASRGFYERLGFAWDGTVTRDSDGSIVRYVLALG
jgi:ribosomal protein S18 acetylase RimI-like enzyme